MLRKMKLESVDNTLSVIGGFLLLFAAITTVVGIIGSVILMFQNSPLILLFIGNVLLIDLGLLADIFSVYLIQKWVRKRSNM
jgi:cytochrome c biogenesis protein CcdA